MSLKSFFMKIWETIEDFFQGLLPELKDAIRIGVTVVQNIKKVMDTPVPDVLTAIIPGDVDDKIKERIREYLPKVLVELRLANECSDLTDPNEIVTCALKTLSQIGDDYQSAFLHDLSVLIAQIAADGKLTWSDGVYLAQWYYSHRLA